MKITSGKGCGNIGRHESKESGQENESLAIILCQKGIGKWKYGMNTKVEGVVTGKNVISAVTAL